MYSLFVLCGACVILFLCISLNIFFGVNTRRYVASFKELQLNNHLLYHREVSNTVNKTYKRDLHSLLRVCTPSETSHLAEYTSSIGSQWFDHAEDRQSGRWFYGSKYRQKIKERAIIGNLGCDEKGKQKTCLERFSDILVTQWRQQPELPTGCLNRHHYKHNHTSSKTTTSPSASSTMLPVSDASFFSNSTGFISCKEQKGGGKQTLCVLTNAYINLRHMKTVHMCSQQEQNCLRRDISSGFLHLSCPQDNPLVKSHLTSKLHLSSGSNGGGKDSHKNSISRHTCDITLTDTVILFSANEIENLGHTLEDFMNIYLMLEVAEGFHFLRKRVTILVVDQLFGGMGRFTEDHSPFYQFLETIFYRVLHASDLSDKVICTNKLVTFTSAKDRFPFIFNGMEYSMECSFKGPSFLYQRWNLLARQAFRTLTMLSLSSPSPLSADMTPTSVLHVLFLLRGNTNMSQQVHHQANRDFSSHSRQQLLHKLEQMNGIHLTAVDLGTYSFPDQMRLIARNNVVIGMHGAAVSMALHMSIGAPFCCGVIEIYNSRTKFGSYQFHGNALRSVGIHYTRVDSIAYTTTAVSSASPSSSSSSSSMSYSASLFVEEEAKTDKMRQAIYTCPLPPPSNESRRAHPDPPSSSTMASRRLSRHIQHQRQQKGISSMNAVDFDIDRVVAALHQTVLILQGGRDIISESKSAQKVSIHKTIHQRDKREKEQGSTGSAPVNNVDTDTENLSLHFDYSRGASCVLAEVLQNDMTTDF